MDMDGQLLALNNVCTLQKIQCKILPPWVSRLTGPLPPTVYRQNLNGCSLVFGSKLFNRPRTPTFSDSSFTRKFKMAA